MNAQTKISTKGQLVVPKSIRDRLHWNIGDAIEIVEHDAAITLRAVPPAKKGLTATEAMARLRKELPYTGPRISDDDIQNAVMDMAGRSHDAEDR